MQLLSQFIAESLLAEKSRYERETGKKFAYELYAKLESLATDEHPATHAFTMIKIPKIGLNPQTHYDTPAGVYFYPLTKVYLGKLLANTLPFVSDNPYFGVVKLNMSNKKKWLMLTNTVGYQSNEDVQGVAQKMGVIDYNGVKQVNVSKLAQNKGSHWTLGNDAKIFDLTWAKMQDTNVGDRQTILWNKTLRDLGFIGIYDGGLSVIHEGEPTQLTCLCQEAYKTVGIWETKELRKESFDNLDDYVDTLTYDKKLDMFYFTGKDVKTSQAMLRKLADDPDEMIRSKVAASDKCPIDILEKFLDDPEFGVRSSAAHNPNLTPEVLHSMLEKKDGNLKFSALAHKNFPANELSKYINSPVYLERAAIASNPNFDAKYLPEMMNDKEIIIRSSIANNKKMKPEWLTEMSKDTSSTVRGNVATNPNTPLEIVKILSKDSEKWVRGLAKGEIARRKKLAIVK